MPATPAAVADTAAAIRARLAAPQGVTAVTLLRLISARADGEINGPAVDAKIAELTARFAV